MLSHYVLKEHPAVSQVSFILKCVYIKYIMCLYSTVPTCVVNRRLRDSFCTSVKWGSGMFRLIGSCDYRSCLSLIRRPAQTNGRSLMISFPTFTLSLFIPFSIFRGNRFHSSWGGASYMGGVCSLTKGGGVNEVSVLGSSLDNRYLLTK